MANVYATKTGNWSDVTVWNTGALPTAADDVRANGFNVTINQNITVISIRTDASIPAVGGGSFSASSADKIINANVKSGTSVCLFVTANNCILNGNVEIYNLNNFPSLQINTAGINFTINGNVSGNGGGSSGTSGSSVRLSANSITLNVTGNITAGTSTLNHGITIDTGNAANINITGIITGSASGTGNGIFMNNGGITCTINGITTGGIASAGINILTGILQGNCIAQGAATAGGNVGVLSATAATTTISEGIYTDCAPTSGKVRFKNINPKVTVVKANGTTSQLVEAGASGDFPIAANVRNGITYASASLTGTLIVPTPDNVRKGVATDATVGTADLTAADMWNALTSSMTTAGSIGERLKNASTVQSNGDQLAAYIV